MVRRLSLASLDSGAESAVYGGEPSASARRVAPAAWPPLSGATRDDAATVYQMLPLQVKTVYAATLRNLRHVGHRPARLKMVCKGHPCIYAADGNPMAWFASSLVTRQTNAAEGSCGSPLTPMRPRKRTDVHGREG
jgi:hypothetical protein